MSDGSAFLSKVVGRKTAEGLNRRRMAILLATLVLVVLASPVAEMTSQALLIVVGATLVFLLSCLQQVDAHPRLRAPTRLIVLLWLALNLLLPWSAPTLGLAAAAMGLAAAALAVLNLIVLWLVAQHLIHADHVDAELLCGAVGAYLLLGVFWAGTYEIISLVAPAAFAAPGGAAPTQSALLYFSFTTLTTTGYGDITAINPIVRMWSIFEAIIGTMYIATVISRLVSLYGSRVGHEDR